MLGRSVARSGHCRVQCPSSSWECRAVPGNPTGVGRPGHCRTAPGESSLWGPWPGQVTAQCPSSSWECRVTVGGAGQVLNTGSERPGHCRAAPGESSLGGPWPGRVTVGCCALPAPGNARSRWGSAGQVLTQGGTRQVFWGTEEIPTPMGRAGPQVYRGARGLCRRCWAAQARDAVRQGLATEKGDRDTRDSCPMLRCLVVTWS